MNVERVAPGYMARPNDPFPVPMRGRLPCKAVEKRRSMNLGHVDGMAAPAGVARHGGPYA